MTYVDGFVLPVPRKKLGVYRRMAREGGKLWKKHGALKYVEAVGDDLYPRMPSGMPGPKATQFPRMARAKPSETVFFSYIVYKSRAHRDRVNASVMKEIAKVPQKNLQTMPFDVRRMAYGGFRALVEF
jgi:uncharacterized protein YbaA (DUF1428 family)